MSENHNNKEESKVSTHKKIVISENSEPFKKNDLDIANQNEFSELIKLTREYKSHIKSIKFLWALVLAVGIGGAVSFRSYVDDKVYQRVERLDRIYLGVSHGNSHNWNSALKIFDEILSDLSEKKMSLKDETRLFLYSNIIWTLANIPERPTDTHWVGKSQWDSLIKDKFFIREYITSNRFYNDPIIQSHLVQCRLKYMLPSISVKLAEKHFKNLSQIGTLRKKANAFWQLAMIDIIHGNDTEALIKIRNASNFDPEMYLISDWFKYKESIFNSSDFYLWNHVAYEAGINDFKDRVNRVYEISKSD